MGYDLFDMCLNRMVCNLLKNASCVVLLRNNSTSLFNFRIGIETVNEAIDVFSSNSDWTLSIISANDYTVK